MRDVIFLLLHLITTVIRLAGHRGLRSVMAESVLLKHQLLIVNRSRNRAPNLRAVDRLVAAVCTLLIRPSRLVRSAIVLKPSTLLQFHQYLVRRKYRLPFSPKRRAKPGPKGPSTKLIGREKTLWSRSLAPWLYWVQQKVLHGVSLCQAQKGYWNLQSKAWKSSANGSRRNCFSFGSS